MVLADGWESGGRGKYSCGVGMELITTREKLEFTIIVGKVVVGECNIVG